MKICIIGFGCAGLAAARHVSEDPKHECVVFEQSDRLGGTWVYSDETGTGRYGLPVHTSMYKGLRTNLPKEIMGYPDFPIPEQDLSYIPSNDFLNFLEKYADHFNLEQYVKFEHHVKLVEPKGDGWEVTVIDLPKNQETAHFFDAVMVCNGHYHTPWYPVIKGMDTFTGQTVHSHDYRDPQPFTGKTVAVIGAGPSGIDLTIEIAKTATKVILSRHRDGDDIENVFPANAEMRYEIVEIRGNKVIFDEGSEMEVDVVFYCTGYKYNFPFLSEKCGIRVEDNCVQPLFKHLIHIEHQTMCLIGLPYYVCACSLFDLQVRFFLKFLNGEIRLPCREEMYRDTEEEMNRRKQKGLKRKQFHMMGKMQGDYYAELAQAVDRFKSGAAAAAWVASNPIVATAAAAAVAVTCDDHTLLRRNLPNVYRHRSFKDHDFCHSNGGCGGLDPLPPVMADLHNHASQNQMDNLVSFRDHVYKVVDDKSFVQVK